MSEIYLHSWTFRGQPLARAIAAACAIGYDGIELQEGHYAFRDDPAVSIAAAHDQINAAGLALAAVPLRLDSRNPSEHAEALRSARNVLAAAAGRTRIVNCMISMIPGPTWSQGGSAAADPVQRNWSRTLIEDLVPLAEEFDLHVCLETHMWFVHDTAAAAAHLVAGLPAATLGINLDLANLGGIEHGEGWDRALQLVGPRMTYLHLKNHRGRGQLTSYEYSLADGRIDWARNLWALGRAGRLPPICIEFSGAGDSEFAARDDFGFVERALGKR